MDKPNFKLNNKSTRLDEIIEQDHEAVMITRSSKLSRLDIGGVKRKTNGRHLSELSSDDKNLIRHEKNFSHTHKRTKTFTKKSSLGINYKNPFVIKNVTPFVTTAMLIAFVFYSLGVFSSAKDSQAEILGVATSAYDSLNSAQANLNEQEFENAQALFRSAQENLNLAQQELGQYKPFIWLNGRARSAENILQGASYLAQAGQKMTEALQIFDQLKVSSGGIETANFNEKLIQNKELLIGSLTLLNKANDSFGDASSIPAEYSETLSKGVEQVAILTGILENLIELEDLYLSFFGDGQKTYVLIFQNYDEIRATGGFIGTYGTLRVDNGAIKKLKIESIYNLDGDIYEEVAAPGPFQPAIKKWGTRDANWFADFPTSAKKILSFFEKGRETADGVIAFTPKLFEDLLKIVGPIEMSAYGVTLTPENFQELVQFKTSVDYDKELNQPKKFLADFAPILLNRLMSLEREQWFTLFQTLQSNMSQKHVLVYSKEISTQQKIANLGFSGEILPAEKDYLNIVNSNLGGTKTDLKIRQGTELNSKILSDGSIINSLKITRTNNSSESNKNYMRVLVPQGSTIVSAEGMDAGPHLKSESEGLKTDSSLSAWDNLVMPIDNLVQRTESGKTEYAFWFNTSGGESKTVSLNYILPFKLNLSTLNQNETYSLTYQKQLGTKSTSFEARLDIGSLNVDWTSIGTSKDGNLLIMNSNSLTDEFWAAILHR